MANNDNLAMVLSQMDNAIKVGKSSVTTSISSNLIKEVLTLMKNEGYLAEWVEHEDSKGNYLTITFNGKLNKCGVIKPRFAVGVDNFEQYEKRYLPALGFGLLFISTNKGLLSQVQAKEENVGGRLISYCY